MRIVINENPDIRETEIIINCPAADEKTARIVSALHAFDKRLTGIRDGKTHLIDIENVLYFDTVDRRAFIYTEGGVYETDRKLYELEQLAGSRFFRSSKSAVVNIAKIDTITPDFGGRLALCLMNGEKMIVSRQYAQALKTLLKI